jgi:hypothetical protein
MLSASKDCIERVIVLNTVMKALATLAIEKTLLGIGKPVYDTVTNRLYEKYHCYTSDCFKKPEYLKAVLKELYGDSYDEIVNSIQEELKEVTYDKKIEMFLQVLL